MEFVVRLGPPLEEVSAHRLPWLLSWRDASLRNAAVCAPCLRLPPGVENLLKSTSNACTGVAHHRVHPATGGATWGCPARGGGGYPITGWPSCHRDVLHHSNTGKSMHVLRVFVRIDAYVGVETGMGKDRVRWT